MIVRYYKGKKTYHVCDTVHTPEFRLMQIRKSKAMPEGVEWEILKEWPKPKKKKKDEK